jgi:DNA-binding CsgD family transcriptional regulator
MGNPGLLATLVDRMRLAVFLFSDTRLTYANPAATALANRLRADYRIELGVLIADHLRAASDRELNAGTVTLVAETRGEPFHLHLIPLNERDVAVTVRDTGTDLDVFRKRYHLSGREAQVASLVLSGYRNRDIADALAISEGTAKKHLTRVFDKVGVDSRAQLAARLP